MAKIDLTSFEWREVVFQGKNKEYGAYKMRSDSNHRHNVAILIVAVATIVGINIPRFTSIFKQKAEVEYKDPYKFMNIDDLKDDKKIEEKVIKPTPPPPDLIKTIKFVPPKIVENEDIRENEGIKPQSELNVSPVRISTVENLEGSLTGKTENPILSGSGSGTGDGDDNTIQTYIEQMPVYPGGEQELLNFIGINLRYPVIDQENNVQGRVVLRFVVTKTGTVDKVEVLQSLSRSADNEAVRVIKLLPKFIPGKQNGKNVSVWFTLPVTFKLQD
ncbi:MAG: TonB family protein [Paludibacter sp.]